MRAVTGFFVISVLTLLTASSTFGQTFNAYVNAGDNAMQRGDYYSATIHYYNALEFDQDNMNVQFKMAEACRNFNDYVNAARYYTQVVLADKKNEFPLAGFWLAKMRQHQGEYEKAKQLYSNYYSHHFADNDYYSLRAKREMDNCDYAMVALKDTLKASITNLGSPVNTVYSDFAGQLLADSNLYYSSLQFETADSKNPKKKKYLSKILRSKREYKEWDTPIPSEQFNAADEHSCNSSFTPDMRMMVYTHCTSVGAALVCNLYESKYDSGRWSLPIKLSEPLNLEGYTSTQPCITTNGNNGYILYFVSDRPGGVGKLDIWRSYIGHDGKYSAPENAGTTINTPDDDITPFYDAKNELLWFASDGHKNLGGYDLFSAKAVNAAYAEPVNAGYPLNTSYNDLYLTAVRDSDYLFSSNRPGSLFIKARTCCYDIYRCILQPAPKIIAPPPDSLTKVPLALLDSAKVKEVSAQNAAEYLGFLPMKLYFDNDMPDKKSWETTTSENYVSLYTRYLDSRALYKQKFSEGIATSEKQNAEKRIDAFFDEVVSKSYQDLHRFSDILNKQLALGNKIEIIVRGSASPLAKSEYNVVLSKRRISSLLNFWKTFNNGALISYMKEKKLFISEEPVGESMTKKGISDQLKDLRNSVYNPDAAKERYIEVIQVKVNGVISK